MVKASPQAPSELSDLVRLLRDVERGKPLQANLFGLMQNHGLLAGDASTPLLTGKGKAFLNAKLSEENSSGRSQVRMPDVLERLANPRKGEATLLANHDRAAGQRFQGDLERAGLRQRTTQSWSYASLVLKSGKHGSRSQRSEPMAMLDARGRVQAACAAMGPELSGLLIDICLYDKSLAIIEKERGWPARSGKLAVALGLKALARHFGLDQVAEGVEFTRRRSSD